MSERAEPSEAVFTEGTDDDEALQRVRTIANSVDAGIYQLDAERRFVAVNDGLLELTGHARTGLLGEHASVLLADTDRGRALGDPGDGAESGEGSSRRTVALLTADGDRLRCEVRVSRIDGGSVVGDGGDSGAERDGGRGAVGVVRAAPDRDGAAPDADGRSGASETPTAGVDDQRLGRDRVVRALEVAREGISLLDEDGVFVYVNEAYAESFGYEPGEMVGEHWDDLGIEANPDRFYDDILPQLAEAGQWTGTTTCVRSDGSTFRCEHSLTRTETGQLICVVSDVTEQRERERRLERYERILENLPLGVYRNTPGPDGEFVTANETLASIFDADSVEELLEHNVSDLYPDPDRRAAFSRTLEREGTVEDVELKQETLEGETIWISVTAIRTEEDGEVYFDGIVQDVTERKRTQQQLAEERDMFAQGPAIVFRWRNEPGWPVEYVSENVEDLLGYPPEALESGDVPYTDLLLESELDRIAEEVETNSDDTTERFSHEPYRVRTRDGDVRWVKDTTKIVRDDAGEITHYLGYLVDITERKERERELAASNERLEQFAYAASHDLQEPLRMVSSYLRLIEQRYGDRLDEDGREYLQFAVDGADRMRHMIEGLLAYSRVDSAGDPLEPVALDDVLADVREDLQVRIEDSEAEIAVGSLPRVEGDEEQLRQLFQNLLDNAIEYSGDEPPLIRVDAERARSSDDWSATDGAMWAVSVSDDGIGVDAEDADRVFEIFQRLHAAEDGQGTGIGLALCRRIVERHGGDIRVESEPGDGATFTFTLPAVEEDA